MAKVKVHAFFHRNVSKSPITLYFSRKEANQDILLILSVDTFIGVTILPKKVQEKLLIIIPLKKIQFSRDLQYRNQIEAFLHFSHRCNFFRVIVLFPWCPLKFHIRHAL